MQIVSVTLFLLCPTSAGTIVSLSHLSIRLSLFGIIIYYIAVTVVDVVSHHAIILVAHARARARARVTIVQFCVLNVLLLAYLWRFFPSPLIFLSRVRTDTWSICCKL